jgi:predicted RNase H-like HicB family nuclease
MRSYTAKYTKISSGYMGQLIEWPEVITEGNTIEECRAMLRDALQEMMEAYKQQGKEIPLGGDLLEQVLIEA